MEELRPSPRLGSDSRDSPAVTTVKSMLATLAREISNLARQQEAALQQLSSQETVLQQVKQHQEQDGGW